MAAPEPEEATRLDWTKRYKSARRIAQLVAIGREVSDEERAELDAWLAGHMRAYLDTCVAQGWGWTGSESDRDEMTAWVHDDFDLDTLGIGIVEGLNAAESMCAKAGWPA